MTPTPTAILHEICRLLHITEGEFVSASRAPHLTRARLVYSGLCREWTTCSFPEIARALGKRNHSSVSSGSTGWYTRWQHMKETDQESYRFRIGTALKSRGYALIPRQPKDGIDGLLADKFRREFAHLFGPRPAMKHAWLRVTNNHTTGRRMSTAWARRARCKRFKRRAA